MDALDRLAEPLDPCAPTPPPWLALTGPGLSFGLTQLLIDFDSVMPDELPATRNAAHLLALCAHYGHTEAVAVECDTTAQRVTRAIGRRLRGLARVVAGDFAGGPDIAPTRAGWALLWSLAWPGSLEASPATPASVETMARLEQLEHDAPRRPRALAGGLLARGRELARLTPLGSPPVLKALHAAAVQARAKMSDRKAKQCAGAYWREGLMGQYARNVFGGPVVASVDPGSGAVADRWELTPLGAAMLDASHEQGLDPQSGPREATGDTLRIESETAMLSETAPLTDTLSAPALPPEPTDFEAARARRLAVVVTPEGPTETDLDAVPVDGQAQPVGEDIAPEDIATPGPEDSAPEHDSPGLPEWLGSAAMPPAWVVAVLECIRDRGSLSAVQAAHGLQRQRARGHLLGPRALDMFGGDAIARVGKGYALTVEGAKALASARAELGQPAERKPGTLTTVGKRKARKSRKGSKASKPSKPSKASKPAAQPVKPSAPETMDTTVHGESSTLDTTVQGQGNGRGEVLAMVADRAFAAMFPGLAS